MSTLEEVGCDRSQDVPFVHGALAQNEPPAAAHCDFVVLGQGLAGTAIAWWLRWSGATVIVIDRETPVTASKIAAGLITPITGQKLVRAWNLVKFWPAATSFYRRVERQTGSSFYRELAMLRLLTDLDEVALFQRRLAAGEFAGLIQQAEPPIDPASFVADYGGFEMFPAGQLHVREYLRASREYFQSDGGYRTAGIDVSRGIELREGQVQIPDLGIVARRIVFCQGIDAIQNPWFRDVQFKPAKGEILGLRIPGLNEDRVVHRGVWLAPIGGGFFKAGSTYDWQHLDSLPTPQGKDEIISQLRQFLRRPFEVISHDAAVRPIHRNQYPVIGVHPVHSQLAYFNGLGSKGSLQSPDIARRLAELLLQGIQVAHDVDLNRKTDWRSFGKSDTPDHDAILNPAFHVKRQANRPLTEQAQQSVRETLAQGELAIDATAGNGHDTQFLAEQVGPSGTVFAFDIQPEALQTTAARLADLSLQNAVLLNDDHDKLSALIPSEFHGRIGAIMFNLGYLPGGDKQIKTNAASSRSAIGQAVRLFRPGGITTIVCYTGHDGGHTESQAVSEELNTLPQDTFEIEFIESQPGRTSGPRLFLVKRRN